MIWQSLNRVLRYNSRREWSAFEMLKISVEKLCRCVYNKNMISHM